MIKSRNLIVALTAVIIATVTLFNANTNINHIGLLQSYPDDARHLTTANYYSGNQGGYQTSAAAWTYKAFH